MISEHVCQNSNHTSETPAFGQATIHFWYGSSLDMKQGTLFLCDECGEKVIQLLKKEFGIKDNFLKSIEEF